MNIKKPQMWEVRGTLRDLRPLDMGKCKHAAAKPEVSEWIIRNDTAAEMRERDIMSPNRSLMGLCPL